MKATNREKEILSNSIVEDRLEIVRLKADLDEAVKERDRARKQQRLAMISEVHEEERADEACALTREAADLVRWARSGRIGHDATKAIDAFLAKLKADHPNMQIDTRPNSP